MTRREEDGGTQITPGAAGSAAGRGTKSGRAREADAGSMGGGRDFVWSVSEASQLAVFRVGTLR